MLKYFISILLILISISIFNCNADDTRTIELVYNPDCTIPECNQTESNFTNSNNLVYVKATGQSDILHILYSTIGTFAIMLFKTNLNTQLNVNWTDLLSNNQTLMFDSIKFSKPLIESCAYLFPIIYEFNDVNGTADMTKINTNSSNWNLRSTKDLLWNYRKDEHQNVGIFEGKDETNSNGSFQFLIRYNGKTLRDKDLPHSLLSSETSAIDFAIDSINPAFKDSKFGLNIQFISNLHGIQLNNRKSLDDEYTPGTFQQWTIEVSDNVLNDNIIHNYLQWKPIFYFYQIKSLENSTITKHYPIATETQMPLSISSAFFDENIKSSSLNISFGLEGNEKDGYFYIQTNYSTFTFTLGLGEPAPEKMSPIVTLVIFIGFGLPALVIVVGLVVLGVRKCKNSSRLGYETL